MNSPNPSPSNSRNTNNSPDYSRNTNNSPDYSNNSGNTGNSNAINVPSPTRNVNLNMVDNSYSQRYNIREYNRSEMGALNNRKNMNNANINAHNNLLNVNRNVDESGMLVKMKKNQKTLNIPVDLNSGIPLTQRWNNENVGAPPSPANGGLFGGPQAVGEYASIPVTPTATNLINSNLLSANPPPGATTQYPGTNRLGNNYIPMPGVYWYNDTHPVNNGPFSMKVVEN